MPSMLKPRSAFESFEASRSYAKTAANHSWAASIFLVVLAIAPGKGMISRIMDADPTTNVTPAHIVAFGLTALGAQVAEIRAVRAEARRDEDWQTFQSLKDKEIAQKAGAAAIEQAVPQIEDIANRPEQPSAPPQSPQNGPEDHS